MTAPPASARPTGVTILAALYLIGAAFAAIGALFLILGGGMFASFFETYTDLGGFLTGFISLWILLVGFVLLVLAVVGGVTGWGLLQGHGWAWGVAIALAGLTALGGLFALMGRDFSGVVQLAIGGAVIWYLWQPGVKGWFGRA